MLSTSSNANPTAILRQVFVERVSRNPSYSLRAFARNLGISHAYLSMILSGKRPIPVRRAVHFSQLAGLDEVTSTGFIAACRAAAQEPLEAPPKVTGSRLSPYPSEYYRLQVDKFRVLSDWYHFAILDLTLLDNFKPDPRWIAKRLGVKTKEVTAAIDRLIRLGMLSTSESGWKKIHPKVEIPTFRPEEAIRRFHLQMIQKATEATLSDCQEDFEARDVTGTTMALNPARLAEAKRRIRRFRRSLLNYVTQGKCTELYQLNVQYFPLTKPEKKRRPA